MINGLGVLGWGVGGIEAEAAMLGQPMPMLIPQVVGFKLDGELPEGATATDLVLTVTADAARARRGRQVRRVLRPGRPEAAAGRPRDDRQHVPGVRLDLRDLPDRRRDAALPRVHRAPKEHIELVEAYAREQGLWHDEHSEEPTYSETLELDLADVVPSLAGPKRPQDRVALTESKASFRLALEDMLPESLQTTSVDEALEETFPASDPPGHNARAYGADAVRKPARRAPAAPRSPSARAPTCR